MLHRSRSTGALCVVLLGLMAGCTSGSPAHTRSAGSSATGAGGSATPTPGEHVPLGDLARAIDDAVASSGGASVSIVSRAIQASGTITAEGAFDITATADWVGDRFVVQRGRVYVNGAPAVATRNGAWLSSAWPTPTGNTRMAVALTALRLASSPGRLLPDLPGADAVLTALNDGRTVYTVDLTEADLERAGSDESGSVLGPSDAPSGLQIVLTLDEDGLPAYIDVVPTVGHETMIRFSDWGRAVAVVAPPASQVVPATLVPRPVVGQGA